MAYVSFGDAEDRSWPASDADLWGQGHLAMVAKLEVLQLLLQNRGTFSGFLNENLIPVSFSLSIFPPDRKQSCSRCMNLHWTEISMNTLFNINLPIFQFGKDNQRECERVRDILYYCLTSDFSKYIIKICHLVHQHKSLKYSYYFSCVFR